MTNWRTVDPSKRSPVINQASFLDKCQLDL